MLRFSMLRVFRKNAMLSIFILSVILPNIVILSVFMLCHYAICQYGMCHNDGYFYVECHYTDFIYAVSVN
jgi:hypothetical protein